MKKLCIYCKMEKNIDFFSNNKLNKDGKSIRCKTCRAELDKNTRLLNNKDKPIRYIKQTDYSDISILKRSDIDKNIQLKNKILNFLSENNFCI